MIAQQIIIVDGVVLFKHVYLEIDKGLALKSAMGMRGFLDQAPAQIVLLLATVDLACIGKQIVFGAVSKDFAENGVPLLVVEMWPLVHAISMIPVAIVLLIQCVSGAVDLIILVYLLQIPHVQCQPTLAHAVITRIATLAWKTQTKVVFGAKITMGELAKNPVNQLA